MRSSSTRSNRAPRKAYLKDSTMMWLLILLAFIILIGGGVASILLDKWNMLPDFVKSGLNPVVLMGTSYYCLALSKRYEARMRRDSAAAQILAEDPRPPIVYLRSFKADDDEGQPRWLQLETQEEKLNSFFSKMGPFVGLGKPDEDFPTLGAARMYVGNGWEQTITDLMSCARLVVLRAGETRSLIWEVKYATQELQPEQLLLLVPAGRKNYEAFRAKTKACFPCPLPEYPSWKTSRTRIKGVIYFESDWTARFLTFKRMFLRGSLTESLPRALQATLRPVYEGLGLPWQPPSINRVRLLLIVLLVSVLIYALYVNAK